MAKGVWIGNINKTDVLEKNKYYFVEMGIIPVPVHDTIARQGIPQDRVEPRMAMHVKDSEIIIVYDNLDDIVSDWDLCPEDYDLGEIEQGEIPTEEKSSEIKTDNVVEFKKPGPKSTPGGIILK